MLGSLLRHVTDFHGDLIRNIKGLRTSQDLFDDLSNDADAQAVAIAAEGATRRASPAPLITRPFDYGTVVTWPFVRENWQATRFSDGLAYGVWYGSLEMETTVHESVHHWHRFVTDSFAHEDRDIIGERRVLRVRCDAILIELRGQERRDRRLVDRRDYTFTQKLGRHLTAQRQNGLLVRSARCSGDNAAVLQPFVLSAVRDACFLTYRTNPTRDLVRVERTPGRRWMEVVPSRLR